VSDLQPVQSTERIDLIDIVRGFALFGVLLANLVWLTTDVVLTDQRLAQLPTAPLDRFVKSLVIFFIDGKFYTLFSFLFGLGFTIQLARAEARGLSAGRLYTRRVAILALIGVLHIALLWYGDILLAYALLGFALLGVRRWNERLLIALAICLALFTRVGFQTYTRFARSADPTTESASKDDAEKERHLAVFDGDSYRAIVRENVTLYYGDLVREGLAWILLPQVFARFLFGFYVGRRRWLERPADLLPWLRRALPWAITLGVLGNGTWVLLTQLRESHVIGRDSGWALAATPLIEAGILSMSFSYLAALVLLYHRSTAWRHRLGQLAPVGRMALTNYLTHSVIYLLAFTGVGIGLYGSVGPAFCLVFAVVVFGAQIVGSRLWLAFFRFGPAEWLWRSLTYGQAQPMQTRIASG
jgi:uncharacterized protein